MTAPAFCSSPLTLAEYTRRGGSRLVLRTTAHAERVEAAGERGTRDAERARRLCDDAAGVGEDTADDGLLGLVDARAVGLEALPHRCRGIVGAVVRRRARRRADGLVRRDAAEIARFEVLG